MDIQDILLLEDDKTLRTIIAEELQDQGYSLTRAETLDEARTYLEQSVFKLVISDLKLPDGNGLTLINEFKEKDPKPYFIMITAFGSIKQAVECLKSGAFDFLTKPINFDHLKISIRKAIQHRKLNDIVQFYLVQHGDLEFEGIIGKSPSMVQVFKEIKVIAPTDEPVLVIGESGTGKELAAKALHNHSGYKNGPFVAVNCASIPEDLFESEFFGHLDGSFTGANKQRKGLFQEAQNGTLFLDEIGELPVHQQSKLLRVIQEKKVKKIGANTSENIHTRIIAATNQDLERNVSNNTFREDLYFRLEKFSIYLPPLRDRKGDIELLLDYFFKHYCHLRNKNIKGVSQSAKDILSNYHYPGNVRELMNIIDRSVTFCNQDTLGTELLPSKLVKQYKTVSTHPSDPQVFSLSHEILTIEELEQKYIQYVLEKLKGNKRRASLALGIGRKTLYRKLSG